MVRTSGQVRDTASAQTEELAGRSRQPNRSRPGRQGLFPLIVFAATVVLLMPQALAGQKTYAAVDLLQLGSPYRDVIDEAPARELAAPIQTDQVETFPWPASFYRELRSGTWSLWDPTVAAGAPKGTLPVVGLLSPFSAGYLFLPAWYAVTLKVALGLLFCQWFTYLLTRRLGAGVLPSTLAGVAYAYTGTNLALLHRVSAFLLAPALLWAAHRLVARPSARRAAVLGGLVAWTWFEGFPSGFAYVMYLTAAWTAWLLIAAFWQTRHSARRPERVRALTKGGLSFGAAGLLGLGLAAINLLPFVDEIGTRGTLEDRTYGHLPPFNVFGLIDLHATGPPWWTGIHPIENVAQIGTIVLLGAGLGLVGAARRRVRLTHDGAMGWGFMCGIVVFGILTSYVGTFVLDLVYLLPGFANNPIHRVRFVIALGASVIAALSLDAWWKSRARDRVRDQELAPGRASLVTLAFGVIVLAAYADDFVDTVSQAGRSVEVATGFVIAAGVGALALVAAWIGRRRYRLMIPVAGVLAALLFVQLAWPLRDFTPESDVELFYERQKGHDVLAELTDGRYRFAGATYRTFQPNSAQLFGTPDLRGFSIHSEEFRQLVETAAPGSVSRDIFKVIAGRDEWDLSSPILDDLAVGTVALSTNDLPYGEVVAESQTWSSWAATDDLPPGAGDGLAPGRIAGVLLPLRRSGGDCDGARVQVSIVERGLVRDTAERPAFDVDGDWLSFALTGQALEAGDAYELRVASSSRACSISVGVLDEPAGTRIARQLIIEDPGAPVHLVATEQAWFYERPNAWELVSTHGSWRSFPTQSGALDYVASRAAAESDVAAFVGEGSRDRTDGISGTVDSFEIGANRIESHVTTPTKNLVVVSQNNSPGWTAKVDGEPAEIVPVDGALMGVFVPAGEHVLTLNYRPRSFVIGAGISAVALLLLIAALVLPSLTTYIRRRRERRPDSWRHG